MKTPIKLGKKYDKSGCCAPSGAGGKDEVYFPSIYLSAVKLDGIPRAGTITFRYELARKSEDFKNDTTDIGMDLLSILEVKTDPESQKMLSTEQTLDKLRDEVVDGEKDEPEGDETREQYVEDDE